MAAAVDRVNFALTVFAMLGMAIPLMLFPEVSALLQAAYDWLAESLGWFYILTAIASFIAVVYVAFGPYAQVRLGEGPPELSTASWIAMLFAAVLVGMMYWSAIEWVFYVDAPPFGADLDRPKPMFGHRLTVSFTGARGLVVLLSADACDCLSVLCSARAQAQIQHLGDALA